MPVKCPNSEIEYLQTMEEVCRESRFDPENMSTQEHLEELCMVAEYLYKTLGYYINQSDFKKLL